MEKLIVICNSEDQANHLAFLLGIPTTSLLAYTDVSKKEFIDPNSKLAFVTILKPYPIEVRELTQSLLTMGIPMISFKFDELGNCEVLKKLFYDLVTQLNSIGYAIQYSRETTSNIRDEGFTQRIDEVFKSYGLHRGTGLDYEVITLNNGQVRLSPKNELTRLLFRLIWRYQKQS